MKVNYAETQHKRAAESGKNWIAYCGMRKREGVGQFAGEINKKVRRLSVKMNWKTIRSGIRLVQISDLRN